MELRSQAYNSNSSGQIHAAAAPLAALAALVAFAGCNSPTGNVTGTVKLDNAPLTRGRVFFHPTDDAAPRRPASGSINANGKYELTSAGGLRGAELGKYKVTVHASSDTNESSKPALSSPPAIPPKYADVDTTPLEAEVAAGANSIDFDLQR